MLPNVVPFPVFATKASSAAFSLGLRLRTAKAMRPPSRTETSSRTLISGSSLAHSRALWSSTTVSGIRPAFSMSSRSSSSRCSSASTSRSGARLAAVRRRSRASRLPPELIGRAAPPPALGRDRQVGGGEVALAREQGRDQAVAADRDEVDGLLGSPAALPLAQEGLERAHVLVGDAAALAPVDEEVGLAVGGQDADGALPEH